MALKLLVDTDFLFGLSIITDAHHQKALATSEQHKKATFYLSPFTVPEAATVISHKVSQAAAVQFLGTMRAANFVSLSFDIESTREVDILFQQQKKKGTSWPDCLNAVLVRTHKLDGILAFDRFYDRVGVKRY